MRVAPLLLVGLLCDGRADAQSCESPVADLSQCPPCPASPKCRRPKPGYQPTHNGCGPEKFSILGNDIQANQVVPQSYEGADFANGGCTAPTLCGCNQHDVCYSTCNASKADCDTKFLNQLKAICWKTFPPGKRDDNCNGMCFGNRDHLGICISRAKLYYKAVAGSGQAAYDEAQKQACECCGTSGKIWCNCNQQCYTTAGDCTAACKATLGCFTGICSPATPQQCP